MFVSLCMHTDIYSHCSFHFYNLNTGQNRSPSALETNKQKNDVLETVPLERPFLGDVSLMIHLPAKRKNINISNLNTLCRAYRSSCQKTESYMIYTCCSPASKTNHIIRGLPTWCSGKESAGQGKRCGFDPQMGKIPCRRKW